MRHIEPEDMLQEVASRLQEMKADCNPRQHLERVFNAPHLAYIALELGVDEDTVQECIITLYSKPLS